MAYDEALRDRLFALVGDEPGYAEKKMFGGVAMLLNGNMACGIVRDGILIRINPADFDELMAEPGARPFEMGHGRIPRGWIVVEPDSCKTKKLLKSWVDRGVQFARTLPPK